MECNLIRPADLDEALAARERYTDDALPIAGGQSLLVMMRNRLVAPRALIDLEPLEALRGVEVSGAGISIGAMNTCRQLIASPVLGEEVAVLPAAARQVSSTAVRNLGTIGGNVCHNEPGADLPPVLLALNARAEVRRRADVRQVPLSEFFTGYFETALEPDEILCRIDIEHPPAGAVGVYLKHAISPEDLAMVGVAAVVVPDGKRPGSVAEVRIGIGGAAPVPLRAAKAEAGLEGAVLDAETARAAGEMAATEVDPPSDPHAGADYRRKMVSVFVRRALLQAGRQIEENGHGAA
ncbi:MAG: xanthine dehydrogenase family protein subunit M [Deltaproteobacteria bacterium]|nr:xanthine dehydrogenase family protein subunit M [Deltaproteobacteria bacterium]